VSSASGRDRNGTWAAAAEVGRPLDHRADVVQDAVLGRLHRLARPEPETGPRPADTFGQSHIAQARVAVADSRGADAGVMLLAA